MEREEREASLKRLGFVRSIAVIAVIYVQNLYLYAINSSALFRSFSVSAERATAVVFEPLYDNLKGSPSRLLLFLDHKVDEGLNKIDEHAPPYAKWAIAKAQLLTQRTSLVAKTFIHEVQINGPSAALCYCGQIFTQLVLILLANFWYMINQITALHVVAQMAIPTVDNWSDAYNKTIKDMVAKGYIVFSYLPHVPKEEITKAYKQVEDERGPVCTICN